MMTKDMNTLACLLERNNDYIKQYEQNRLLVLIKSDEMQDINKRAALLDCIQVFSNYFQKTVMLRGALTESTVFLNTARAHLAEEFGHDISLMSDRNNRLPIWDAILDACSCWFSWKMLTLDNIEKTLLVHLVLESSANVFFKEAHKVMQRYGETDYFKMHAAVDEHHEAMGVELLQNLRKSDYGQLLIIQKQGWDVLNTVSHRIAEVATGDL